MEKFCCLSVIFVDSSLASETFTFIFSTLFILMHFIVYIFKKFDSLRHYYCKLLNIAYNFWFCIMVILLDAESKFLFIKSVSLDKFIIKITSKWFLLSFCSATIPFSQWRQLELSSCVAQFFFTWREWLSAKIFGQFTKC